MSAVSLVWIAIIILRVLASAKSGGASRGRPLRWRWIVWWSVVAGWFMAVLMTLLPAWGFALSHEGRSFGSLAVASVLTTIAAAAGVALFFPWPVLHAIARRGHPRVASLLGHLTFVFFATGETHAAATLLAAVGLARRGGATADERAWLERRLRAETRFLGTFATAHAFACGLEARALSDAGELAAAKEWQETARVLLGTVTYLSRRGVPQPVRRLAYEYLALDAARQAQWGGVHVPPDLRPSKVHRTLYAWARTRFFEPEANGAPPKLPAGELGAALAARPREVVPIEGARDALARAQAVYVDLWKGVPVPPRDALNMLMAMDVLAHPEASECLLPETVRSDAARTAVVHDALAAPVALALLRLEVPLHALPRFGPISARVYAKVERELFGEWARAVARVKERCARMERTDGYGEWLEVSRLRRIYRRIEYCLGEPVVARLWPEFAHAYGALGVQLSEAAPRRRPLAHAVFACMSREAARFQDVENVDRQASNMRITSGDE